LQVGELFVSIGVKGMEKVGESLSTVNNGMKTLMGSSLETKAAIAGVFYGFDRLMSSSTKTGMALENFTGYTGKSTETLQKMQVAALKSGISMDEVENSVVSLQEAMTKLKLEGASGLPGFKVISDVMGKLDPNKMKDPYYLMSYFRNAAQSTKIPVEYMNNFLKQVGLSRNMISWMRNKEKSNWESVPNSDIQSEGTLKQLDRVGGAQAMLGLHIQRHFEAFTAKHGMKIIGDLDKLQSSIFGIVSNVDKLVSKFPQLETVGVAAALAMTGAFAPLSLSIGALLIGLSEIEKYIEGKPGFLTDALGDPAKGKKGAAEKRIEGLSWEKTLSDHKMDLFKTILGETYKGVMLYNTNVHPPMSGAKGNASNPTTINTTVNVTGMNPTDSAAAKAVMSKAAQSAAKDIAGQQNRRSVQGNSFAPTRSN
jgi:hypothetical protein